MRISVFGLGYVGVVSVACLARDGHEVIGVDIDHNKLELLRNGKSPVMEEGIVELIEQVSASGRLQVSDDAASAVAQTEVSIICVGTPSAYNGSQDQSAIRRTCQSLGTAMAGKEDQHLFVFRSTVLPGTVEGTLIPLLEKHSGKCEGTDFSVCFQPEFLREGTSIKDYDNPPYTIVGCRGSRPADTLRDLFGHLPNEFVVTSIRVAETVKYFCNIFHALKITFANEVGRICQSVGVSSHDVMALLCKDHQLNISPAYLRPGFAFGGSCLPKDLRAMLHLARHQDVDVPMLDGILKSNAVHIQHALRYVLASGKRKVGMIGLSFKSGTDDLRESPLVALAEQLIGKGMDLQICDPAVHLSGLMGANKRFIEETIPHIGSLLVTDHLRMIQDCDVIIVGQNNPEIIQDIIPRLSANQLVLDFINVTDRDSLKAKYMGVCW